LREQIIELRDKYNLDYKFDFEKEWCKWIWEKRL
jgi:hypothetical protein